MSAPEPVPPSIGRWGRAFSAVVAAVPLAALAIAAALLNPLPLVLVVAWLYAARHLPHERPSAGIDWWLPAPGVQLRRLAWMVLLPVTFAFAALMGFSAALTMATVERGWLIVTVLVVGTAVSVWLATRLLVRFGFERPRVSSGAALLPPALALGFAITALWLAALDRVVVFQYTLFLAMLLGIATLLAVALVRSVRGLSAGGRVVELELPLATLLVASLLGIFVATLELSALGSYDLLQLADRSSRHELRPSARARIDSFGFRGPERTLAKPAGVLRVAVLGDSMTYGWFVNEESTFARVLETELVDALPGTGVEVVNAGVPAYSLRMMRERFGERVRSHEPDVVLVVDGGNVDAPGRPGYEAEVRATVMEIRAAGATAVLCGYPFGSRQLATRWTSEVKQDLARELSLRYVDLGDAERGLGERFFQLDEMHPTVAGHAAIAALLAPVVREALLARIENH